MVCKWRRAVLHFRKESQQNSISSRLSRNLVLTLLILTLVSANLAARDLRHPQFLEEAQQGFDQIFNLDYEPAIQTFSALQTKYPEHPGPPLYRATAIWLRELFERRDFDLDKFIAPSYFDRATDQRMPMEPRQAFFDLIEQGQKLAEVILEEEPMDKDTRYYLGTFQGVLAAFSITIDHSRRKAFSYGKKAYQYHKELVEEDPDYYDAYLSVGLYEYIVGNLPWYIKWLATIAGYHGNEKTGFEYLNLAAEKGQYVADEARVLQMVLYVRENQYAKALESAQYLHEKYPRSFLSHLNLAQMLEKMGEKQQAAAEYRQVVQWAEAGKPNYQKIDLPIFRYTVGRKLMELEQWEFALEEFQKLIKRPGTSNRERVLSHLMAGQIFDLQGKRSEAIAQYEEVLKLQDFEASHNRARDFLRRPYQVSLVLHFRKS